MNIKELVRKIKKAVNNIEKMQREDLHNTQMYPNWNSFTGQLGMLSIILKRSDPDEVRKQDDIVEAMFSFLHEAEAEIKEMVSEENKEDALGFYRDMDTTLHNYCHTAQSTSFLQQL